MTANAAHQGLNDPGLDRLRRMMRGRAIEDVIGSVSGHYHPARGEEGVIVGAFSALDERDVGLPHYRGAVIASLTRGADMHELLAGVLGKVTGPTRGRQRGDFLGKFSETSFGLFSGTLGPSIGYAVGSGLAAKLDGSMSATVVTFGDGTANSGLLYESMNMAGMLNLPVVFVCQNNQYAVSMPSARSIAGGSLSSRAAAFGIPAVTVNGNDVIAVENAVREALELARQGQGPSFIDAQTYRVSGHWVSDACAYRESAETERWRNRDPIMTLTESLISGGHASRDEIDRMAVLISEEAQAAMAAAQADPWPDPSVIDYRNAYVA